MTWPRARPATGRGRDRFDVEVERLGPDDLAYLAMAPSSSSIVAVLELGAPAPSLADLRRALAARIDAVPRLRQVVQRVPFGCGRPVWVDHAAFDLHRHVTERSLVGTGSDTAGAGEDTLLRAVAEELTAPLAPTRPLWRLTLVTGLAHGRAAAVVVIHHVLTDGIGGLAVLATLTDAAESDDGRPVGSDATVRCVGSETRPFPRPAPSVAQLRRDRRRQTAASLTRLRPRRDTLSTISAAWRELRPLSLARDGTSPDTEAGDTAAGDSTAGVTRAGDTTAGVTRAVDTIRGSTPPGVRRAGKRSAPAVSLLTRTGPRRALAATTVPLAEVSATAHALEASVNDVVLAAVTDALGRELAARGEHPSHLVASVPVTRRRSTSAGALGNAAGVMLVPLPVAQRVPEQRVRAIAAVTARRKGSQRGVSQLLLRPLFRAALALGIYRWFIDRQRMINTFVSNLRGPPTPLFLAGSPVTRIVPVGSVAGNVAVAFTVLSYAGRLTVTVVVDPDVVPDPGRLALDVERALTHLTSAIEAADVSAPGRPDARAP